MDNDIQNGEFTEGAENDLLIEDISVEEELITSRARSLQGAKYTPPKKPKPIPRVMKIRNGIMITLFALILLVGGVIGMFPQRPTWWNDEKNDSPIPWRPSISYLEKRDLTNFPKFTKDSFLNGEFLDQLQTWYADTYPERELLMGSYSQIEYYFGIKEEVVVGTSHGQGDVIPTAPLPTEPGSDPVITPSVPSTEESPIEIASSGNDPTEPDGSSEETSPEMSETETEPRDEPKPTLEPPTIPSKPEETLPPAVEGEGKFGGIFVSGDTAYSMYYFSLEGANNYITHVNNMANALDGTTNVYCMLLPTSCYFYMNDAMKAQYGVANENDAIKYMYSSMNSKVHTVSVIPTLQDHIDEYLFFRTDHHWTQLGAYYAYQEFASVKGITPHPLSYYTPMEFPGFLGTFYSETLSPRLAANPDTVYAYVPHGTNIINSRNVDGSEVKWYVVNDVSGYNKYNKYATFICGDKPFSVIENPEITDGSSCLVIKESFGNAFVPFMVDHYQYTYIIDYRYNTTDGLITFCKSHNVTDLIYANVAELITPSSVAKMNSLSY